MRNKSAGHYGAVSINYTSIETHARDEDQGCIGDSRDIATIKVIVGHAVTDGQTFKLHWRVEARYREQRDSLNLSCSNWE
jgi:hypothetical protein